jgi:tryptophanyl-tRNA synthetase
MSLKQPNLKMSKSHEDPRSRILLTDSDDSIKDKIKRALTDSIDGISYDPETRPGVSNLIMLLQHVNSSAISPVEIALSLDGMSMREFKNYVADAIIATIRPIRERYFEIMGKEEWLDDVAANGAQRARENGCRTRDEVFKAIGLR